MADAVSQASKSKILVPQEVSSDHANPSKFFTHFLYKAALVTVFLVLLPLFPSVAPEFINQALHARSWELFQLIFVGIAVSYGLFSKKNDEADKEYHHNSKLDNAQSYVSKLLHVSSVFDDDSETQTVIDENKVQTWSSQYYRGEPVVVVAKESAIVDKKNSTTSLTSEISQRPLLLPVRSLNQRVSNRIEVDLVDDSGGSIKGSSFSRTNSSNSGSKRFSSNSRKSRIAEIEGLESEEKSEENVVLRSPIPWRSRSGKMEMKENGDIPDSTEPELNRILSRSFRSNRNNSSSLSSSSSKINSPCKLSPSQSFSSQSQTKSSEDAAWKKNLPSSFSPPPPPPPPPPRKSVVDKPNSALMNNVRPTPTKVLRRSARSVPSEELNECGLIKLSSRVEDDGDSGRSFRRFSSFSQSVEYDKEKFVEKKEIEDKGMVEKVLMETSDDEDEDESELDDDYFEKSTKNNGEGAIGGDNNLMNDVGPDVDKKADEFIAKFREQIRLQRIESIRRSTAQRAGRTFK